MLTAMTEEDWAIVLQVFRAVALAARRQGARRPEVSGGAALFLGSQHHLAGAAGEFGNWNSVWKRFWRLSRVGRLRGLLRCARQR